jgi:hypothetical protein
VIIATFDGRVSWLERRAAALALWAVAAWPEDDGGALVALDHLRPALVRSRRFYPNR